MRRDDFGMRIDEIRELATKYSKGDLARMVKMGMLDPQRALMAGMMIDRIAKSAMAPPQTTVAEDVLAAPTTAQGQIPQGVMGAPGAPEPSPGVAALPTGLQNMAGGGIVAFADGGEADIPGYAGDKESLVDAGIIDKIDPNWRSARNRKIYSSEDKFATLAEQLRELQRDLGSATGEDKRRIESNIAQVQQEMRKVKPSRAMTGLETLIPSAEAAAPQAAAPAAPAGTQRPKTARERLFEQQVMEEYGLGPQKLTPEQQRASQESAQRALDYQAKQKQLQQLEGGFFSQKPLTEQQASEAERIRSEMRGIQSLPPIAPPSKSAAPTTFPPTVTPPPAEEAPAAESRMGPPRPTEMDRLMGSLRGAAMEVPKEKSLKDVAKEQEEADVMYGVDKEMFNNLRRDYKEMGGKLKDRADKAAGMAIMMFAAGLAGAREGEEWQTASRAGQQALMSYMGAMDKINDNEDRLAQSMRDLDLAENQYKRSRSKEALAEVNSTKREIRAIELENAKFEQQALLKGGEFTVEMIKNQNPAMYQTLANIAQEQRAKGNKGYTTLDALRDYQGVQKTGEVSRDKAYAEWAKEPTIRAQFPKFEDYWAGFQSGSGSPSGTFDYVRGKGLVPNK